MKAVRKENVLESRVHNEPIFRMNVSEGPTGPIYKAHALSEADKGSVSLFVDVSMGDGDLDAAGVDLDWVQAIYVTFNGVAYPLPVVFLDYQDTVAWCGRTGSVLPPKDSFKKLRRQLYDQYVAIQRAISAA
jgi:hypothetical protein